MYISPICYQPQRSLCWHFVILLVKNNKEYARQWRGQCISPCFHPETLNAVAWRGKCSCSKVSTLLWTIIRTITAVVKVIWLPGTTDLMLCTVIWLPPSACALSLCRGISGTSLHLWSEGEGTPKASCWVRDVTCGTELHAVWPRSGHSSRSGEAQHDRNPTIQICQRWQDSAGKLCAPVSRGSGVGGRGLVCWVSFFFGFITIMVLLLYSYCMISSERQRLWHISLARGKAAVSFLQSVYHDTFLR